LLRSSPREAAFWPAPHRHDRLQWPVAQTSPTPSTAAPQQKNAKFWREKWNFQNFKLNVLADMLVLRLIEVDPSLAALTAPGGSEADAQQQQQQQQQQQAGGWSDAAPAGAARRGGDGKGGAGGGRGKQVVVAARGFEDDDFGGEASLEELTL
jgi:hypothetical protein